MAKIHRDPAIEAPMLRLHGIIGTEQDTDLKPRLRRAEHHGGVEVLFVEEAESGRKRFRLTTDKGTDCAVSLDRDQSLVDGAVLYLTDERAIVVRFGAPRLWRLVPTGADAALRLGWNAGNLHWRVRFEGANLVVLLDAPLADYRARIAPMLADGSVREAGDD